MGTGCPTFAVKVGQQKSWATQKLGNRSDDGQRHAPHRRKRVTNGKGGFKKKKDPIKVAAGLVGAARKASAKQDAAAAALRAMMAPQQRELAWD